MRAIRSGHRGRRAIGLVAALVLGASGCTKLPPADHPTASTTTVAGSATRAAGRRTIPHTLRIGDTFDITTLNPHLATAASLNSLSELTMAYLVRYDAHNRPIPELALEVPTQANHLISADGLTITWHLRRGVKWSDGAPFDADDVVFSTNAVNNPKNDEVGRDGWDLIAKIDEPDKYTVVYHLRKPYSGFLPTFFGSAGANPCILPKHLLAQLPDINNADYNSKPVGIGPFRYVRWVRNDHIDLEANPYYWRGKPKLERIVYKFIPDSNTLLTQLQTGEVDLWPLIGAGFFGRVNAIPGVRALHFPGYFYNHLDFNLKRPLFAELAVREALRASIDRRGLIDRTQHGLGVLQEGMVTPASPFYTAFPLVPHDVAHANALLDAAGWKRGPDGVRVKNGKRLAFDFALVSGSPDSDERVELLRAGWQQIGVAINVLHYAPALMFAPYSAGGILYGGKFDMIAFSWQLTPDGDMSTTLGCAQVPPNGQNVLHYCRSVVDGLLAKAKAAYGENERRPLIAAIQRQVIADVPTIVLGIREDVYAYDANLTGWHPNAVTAFDDMLGVDI